MQVAEGVVYEVGIDVMIGRLHSLILVPQTRARIPLIQLTLFGETGSMPSIFVGSLASIDRPS